MAHIKTETFQIGRYYKVDHSSGRGEEFCIFKVVSLDKRGVPTVEMTHIHSKDPDKFNEIGMVYERSLPFLREHEELAIEFEHRLKFKDDMEKIIHE